MNRLILSALGLSAALITAMPAAAQDQISVHVSYADLNLASNAGAAVLKQRMDDAVTQICGKVDPRNMGAMTLVQACRHSTSVTVEHQFRRIVAAARMAQPMTFAKADPAR